MADNDKDEKKGPEKMEVGGTGTAKAKFKDSFGKDIKVKNVQWAASGSVVVTPDDKDPSTAKLLAVGAGPSTLRAVGEGEEGGHAEARFELMVLEKDAAAEGEIEVSTQPAPARPKPAEAKKEPSPPQSETHGSSAHASAHR